MYYYNKIAFYIVWIFPFALTLGAPAVNLLLIISSIFFLYIKIKNKEKILKEAWEYIFIILWIYLIITSFFSIDFLKAFKASFSQIRFLLFSLFLGFYFNLHSSYKKIFFFWKFILAFVSIDLIYQFFTGVNFFGFPAENYVPGVSAFSHIARLGGVFNDELVAGSFIAKLSYPIMFYLACKFQSGKLQMKLLSLTLITLFSVSVFITGERLSFIIILSAIFFSSLLILDLKKILILVVLLSSVGLIFYEQNRFLKNRVTETIEIIFNIQNSSYGRIFQSSYEVWKKNKLIGSGLKNYNNECVKLKDKNIYNSQYAYCSPTHSHNILLQVMSETGFIGLIIFIALYFSLLKYLLVKYNRIKYDLNDEMKSIFKGCYTFIIIALFPFITSGSFFTSWNGSFFWLHIGLALATLNSKKLSSD
jgi:O-antigen ligase